MDLDLLKNFVHVARLGSFSQAAHVAHIAQPALSKQIQRIEQELGIQLFDRTGRRIRLTDAGQKVLQQAQKILFEWSMMRSWVDDVKNLDHGSCRIAAFPNFIFFLAPYFLVEFIKIYPDLNLEIEQAMNESTNETLIQWVLQSRFDCGIVALPANHPHLIEIPLYVEEAVLVVDVRHPLAKSRIVPASEIGQHPLVLPTLNVSYRSFLANIFSNVDVQLQVKYIVHDYRLLFQLVKSGVVAGIAPLIAVDPNDSLIKAVHISPPLVRQIGWIERRGNPRSPAIDVFFKALTKFLMNQNIVPSLVKADIKKSLESADYTE
jgi:LysR family cyn operon transcriptional activator